MLLSCCNNNNVNYMSERCLPLTFDSKCSSYEELVQVHGLFFIHSKSIQDLTIQIFKVKNSLTPQLFSEIDENHYSLRHNKSFRVP